MRLPGALEPGPGLQRLHEQGHLLLQAVEATLPPCGPGGQSAKPEGYYRALRHNALCFANFGLARDPSALLS